MNELHSALRDSEQIERTIEGLGMRVFGGKQKTLAWAPHSLLSTLMNVPSSVLNLFLE